MKVSVAIITYNHEAFIAEALDSVLAQDVDFEYEIVIGDDCSQDRTAEIVADYQRRHPDIIKAVLNETNIGANPNLVQTLNRCEGDYIALLDGDDFWTSADKMHRQAAVLDTEADCALVFNAATIISEQGGVRPWYPPGRKRSYDLRDLLKGNFIATGSVMYRNMGLQFPDWYDESRGMPGDWLLFSIHARHGSIRYLDEIMSVYRLHSGGIWNASPKERVRRLRALIEIGERLNADFDDEYTASVRRAAMVNRLKIGVARTTPFIVGPLVALRHRLGGGREGWRRQPRSQPRTEGRTRAQP